MDRLRDIALRLLIALNLIALVVSFGESFYGLFEWASHHGVAGIGAAVWPLMIDVVILVGEAGLFIAHHGHWRVRDKAWMWFITLTALGVSAAANIGHVVSTDWLSHLTAALPPAALFFSMTVGFGVMKRIYLNKKTGPVAPVEPPAPGLSPSREWSGEKIRMGTTAWTREPSSQALTETSQLPSQPLTENLETPLTETSQLPVPESLSPTDTFAAPTYRATPKSYSQPDDKREGLTLREKRVRDMYTMDPDISVNSIATALGVAWGTAKKYLDDTKIARGLTA